MNPYFESELESHDLYCEICGCLISTDEYYEYDGYCESCWYDENEEGA